MWNRITFALLAGLVICFSAHGQKNAQTSFTWNPELSKSGPVVVSVNLETQTAAVYRGGVLIGSCMVSSGKKGYETPTGVFHILEKDADHRSSTYGNAPMPFSERLTWGGVALHGGGLPGYPSSHGCVHLPLEFSKKLFEVTAKGTTVVITDGGPADPVSKGHRIEFGESDSQHSEVVWKPHDSPDGPVSILFSASDKEVLIVRNGVVIGKGPAHLKAFAAKPKGTYAYIFDGWSRNKKGEAIPHWHQVGGPSGSHQIKSFSHIKMSSRLKHILEGALRPGVSLVITEDALSKATRTEPGFLILQGGVKKKLGAVPNTYLPVFASTR